MTGLADQHRIRRGQWNKRSAKTKVGETECALLHNLLRVCVCMFVEWQCKVCPIDKSCRLCNSLFGVLVMSSGLFQLPVSLGQIDRSVEQVGLYQ